MNIENARKNLPLKKLTFTEYGEFRDDKNGDKNWFHSWNVKLETCRGGDCEDDFKKFEPYRDLYFQCRGPALAAANLFAGAEHDFTIAWAVGASELDCPPQNHLLLMQFIVTERVYGRDSGCSWSDPENDIRKKAGIECMVRLGWGGDIVNFSTGASRLSSWSICEAYRNCVRVMETGFPSREEQKNIVGFEWNDRVYGNPFFRTDDPSVLGDPIDGRTLTSLPFPGDGRELDGRADINYLHDYIFWHQRNHIYIVGGNFFLNGEMILTVDNLVYELVGDDIEKLSPHDLYKIKSSICENSFYQTERALEWIAETFPDATEIVGDHGNFSMTLKHRTV